MRWLVPVLVTLFMLPDGSRAQTGYVPQQENVRAQLAILAHDSMEGRRTATAGAVRAARYIASVMQAIGLEPGGDQGYVQRVPLANRPGRGGRMGLQPLVTQAALDSVPEAQRIYDANLIGIIRGVDPALRDSAIIVGAHYDHVGMRAHQSGDSIYNGADDDASGVVAVLEAARALKSGPPPKRTVVFVAFTGEEMGGLGSRYYIARPPVPLASTVAQLQVEMIARPDSLVGGAGKAWLTGFERSTMGELLRTAGIEVAADPRPSQSFFTRSDNVRFARIGIPAHTLSSFNLHAEYHQPSDEIERVDYAHMAELVRAVARAVRVLADGAAPRWHPNGRPQ
ncbi:MAG: M20/M25/M40 family metallo-hydrolase [Longimicrobiales bacterium]